MKGNIQNKVFFNNINTYIKIINNTLSQKYKVEPLGNYIKITGGAALKSTHYKNHGIPIIRISDFNNEKIDLTKVKYYEENDKFKKVELKEGDIIIALTGGTIGKLAIVQKGLGKLYMNQRVGKFEPISNDIIVEYIYWLARGVQNRIKELAWGGAQPNVSGKQIERMKFPIPPKDIQKQIVKFLNDLKNNTLEDKIYFNSESEKKIISLQHQQSKIFSFISELTAQRTYIQKLRQQVLQEAIQGKLTEEWRRQHPGVEPASELLKRIKAEKERLVKEGKIKKSKPLPPIKEEEKPFELPEGWVWCRLGEVGYTKTGTTPPSTEKENFGSFISFIKPADITLNGINYSNFGLSEKGLKHGRLIPEYSILMVCIGGSIGKSYYNDRKVSCNQQINTITPLKEISVSLMQNILQSNYFQKSVWDRASGGAAPIINRSKWEKIPIPLSSADEQDILNSKIQNMINYANQLYKQTEKNGQYADKLMQAVLREAFEG